MRLHITLDDELVGELDREVQPGGRSAFIVAAVRKALDTRRREKTLLASAGAIADSGHDWDDDPADWVRRQRAADARRVG